MLGSPMDSQIVYGQQMVVGSRAAPSGIMLVTKAYDNGAYVLTPMGFAGVESFESISGLVKDVTSTMVGMIASGDCPKGLSLNMVHLNPRLVRLVAEAVMREVISACSPTRTYGLVSVLISPSIDGDERAAIHSFMVNAFDQSFGADPAMAGALQLHPAQLSLH